MLKLKDYSLAVFFLMTLIFFSSCGKGKYEYSQMKECHNKLGLDSAEIHNLLVGEWNWNYYSCFWTPENANGKDFKGLAVNFNGDGTVNIIQDDVVTQTSVWHIEKAYNEMYAVKTDPRVDELQGPIMFCNKQVGFMNSFGDVCDHFFKRSK